ncbi:MAG: relaxase/mobilization nuclease domain-containing protein [Chitinophagaceae bacterium]|jgi:hypothetical protein
MVARIKIGKSIIRAFRYNENKINEGFAQLLAGENFPAEAKRLSEFQRLNVLQKVASLNPNVTTNSVHISLNFDPSEVLSDDRLKAIAKEYMDRIGFGQQPFIVYRHNDSGHPHIHILTTRIALDGSTISVHNIGKAKSEPARKELEIMFGLMKAEDSKKANRPIQSAYVQKVNYGKTESKKAIESVLNEVVRNYKFTSIPELNAVLNLYSVRADRGTENSRTFKNNGLHYKIIDSNGDPVGVPIKASLFAGKPTLKFLEWQFKNNEPLRLPHKARIKNTIDFYCLNKNGLSLDGLVKALDKEGIKAILRTNENGIVYGLTYVDHKTKCVFNGGALGKPYSANGIRERLQASLKKPLANWQENIIRPGQNVVHDSDWKTNTGNENTNADSLLNDLLHAENTGNDIPYELRAKKRKRRKRKSK